MKETKKETKKELKYNESESDLMSYTIKLLKIGCSQVNINTEDFTAMISYFSKCFFTEKGQSVFKKAIIELSNEITKN